MSISFFTQLKVGTALALCFKCWVRTEARDDSHAFLSLTVAPFSVLALPDALAPALPSVDAFALKLRMSPLSDPTQKPMRHQLRRDRRHLLLDP